MKRKKRKLVMVRDTIRTLAQTELRQAAGGDEVNETAKAVQSCVRSCTTD